MPEVLDWVRLRRRNARIGSESGFDGPLSLRVAGDVWRRVEIMLPGEPISRKRHGAVASARARRLRRWEER
jgi:hypothetical protein